MRFKCVGRPSSGPGDPGVQGCGHEWREKPLGPAPPAQVQAGVHGYESRTVTCPKCPSGYVWWMNSELWDGPQRISDKAPDRQQRKRPFSARWRGKGSKRARR